MSKPPLLILLWSEEYVHNDTYMLEHSLYRRLLGPLFYRSQYAPSRQVARRQRRNGRWKGR